MYRFVIVYSFVAVWTFGWLTGTFGLMPSLIASALLFTPSVLSWRLVRARRPIKRREYGYICLVTLLVIGAFGYIVDTWYRAGMDRLAMFDREYRAFLRHVAMQPEYKNVEISYTPGMGRRVYLKGTVSTKESHDRLVQTLERMVRNTDIGHYDGTTYPGELTEK